MQILLLRQRVPFRIARIPVVVKVSPDTTIAVVFSEGIILWTMCERCMAITNFVEEMDLFLFREQRNCHAVNWCVTPTLIVETSGAVQKFSESRVCLSSPKPHIGDFEITPEMAQVVVFPTIVREESHGVVLCNELWVLLHKLFHSGP